MGLEENIWDHYGMWGAVLFWIILYSIALFFLPFYRKSQKVKGTYLAFIVAFAVEMHGIPFSMYLVGWLFGRQLPEGIFWGHTLQEYIGVGGMYVAIVFIIIGFTLIISGWRRIYMEYWIKESGEGSLVTGGIYRYIRHPQYTGLMFITMGMIFEWATIPLLIMWPLMVWMYYRLARREEKDMEEEFGVDYLKYKENTGMFFPIITGNR
jgi:protein-S-isoprenylcysteine O-methyltransferase Ste14